jgi:hypothetical protein
VIGPSNSNTTFPQKHRPVILIPFRPQGLRIFRTAQTKPQGLAAASITLVGVSEKQVDGFEAGVSQNLHPTRYRHAVAYKMRISRAQELRVVVTKNFVRSVPEPFPVLSAVTARLPRLPFGESGGERRLAASGLDEQKHTAGAEQSEHIFA